jgi:hypothetical protein
MATLQLITLYESSQLTPVTLPLTGDANLPDSLAEQGIRDSVTEVAGEGAVNGGILSPRVWYSCGRQGEFLDRHIPEGE